MFSEGGLFINNLPKNFLKNNLTKKKARGTIMIQLHKTKAVTKTVLRVVSFRESVVGVNRQKLAMTIPSEPSAERLAVFHVSGSERASK